MNDEDSPRPISRGRSAIALGLVGALVLGAVGWAVFALAAGEGEAPTSAPAPAPSQSSTPSPTPVDPDATLPPDPALAEFYAQQLTWETCREDFKCATLAVPLDYRKPRGKQIEIAVLKVPATGGRIGSLVVNPGGPGASGTAYAEAAERVLREPLLESFDTVGFDPRGTGDSTAIDCLTDSDLDEYVAADPDPDTAAEVRAYVSGLEELGAGCTNNSGALARHVSTIEAAQDMDVLRAALGEAQLNYLGASYGTQLGATYADLFPQRAGRLVLDGAVDLSLTGTELGLQQAAGFEVALRSYVENCVDKSDSCFLGDSVDDGVARIQEFLDDVEEEALSTDLDGRRLEVGNAFYGLVAPLYARDAWSALSLGLRQAFNGDGTTMLLLSDAYTSRGAETYNDNSIEANITINCLDKPARAEATRVESTYPTYDAASPTFGRVFAWSVLGCNGFPAEPELAPREIRAEGAAPILVVGTTRDPATPMRWAEALADQLESGVLLRRDGDGHTAYNSDNQCIDEAIEGYLLDGTVPPDGTTC